MMAAQFSYNRHRDEWQLVGPEGSMEEGALVTVTRRDGAESTVRVARILWERANATLKHRVRELEAERDRYREAVRQARVHLGHGRIVEADNVLHAALRGGS